MNKKDILNPYTKEPLIQKKTIKCRYIPSAGITLCDNKNDDFNDKKIIIYSLISIVIVGLLFAFNVTVTTNDSIVDTNSLYTLSNPFLFIIVSMFIGYMIGLSNKSRTK